MKFGDYFKKLIKDKKFTKEQVAQMIGKSTMLVSGVETDKNGPFLDRDLEIISDGFFLSESEKSELYWEAAKTRNILPSHISKYVLCHSYAILILEIMKKNNINDVALKRVMELMEEIGDAKNS